MTKTDRRYLKTEAALLDSYSKIIKKGPSKLTPSNISKKAGISRSTLYRHYQDLDEIYNRQKSIQVHRMKILLNRLGRKNLSDQAILKHLLINYYHHHTFFELDLAYCNSRATLEILWHLKLKCLTHYKTREEKNIAIHHILAHLDNWRCHHFNLDNINQIANKIFAEIKTMSN